MQSYFLAETLKYLYLLFAPKTRSTFDKCGLQYRGAPAPQNLVADPRRSEI